MDRPDHSTRYVAAAAENEISESEIASAPALDSASEVVSKPDTTLVPKDTSTPEIAYAPAGWSPLTRLGFRIAFIYFICFMWLYGNDGIDSKAIVMWHGFSNLLKWPLDHLAIWSAHYLFRLKSTPKHWHVIDRSDRLINRVLNGLFALLALVGGVAWTAIAALRGSTRTEYRTLLAWLRFFLRLSVGFFMIGYGMLKVFPLQMGPIPIAVLNGKVGQISSQTLLWSFMGLYPIFESLCGLAEVVAGTLVLFRRTALAGALLSIFMMSNVLLYDVVFRVGVSLFALNLLLAAIFIALPDAQPLFDFFWRHQPAAQTGVWTPPLSRRGVRIYVRALEVVFIVGCFTINPLFDGIMWQYNRAVARVQSPLLGAWRLDSIHPATGAFLTPKGPATELYVDTVQRAMTRSLDGSVWRNFLRLNAAAHTVWIGPYIGNGVIYNWRTPDANHLILVSVPPNKAPHGAKAPPNAKSASLFTPEVLTLTRIPLPAHYPLFNRNFRVPGYY